MVVWNRNALVLSVMLCLYFKDKQTKTKVTTSPLIPKHSLQPSRPPPPPPPTPRTASEGRELRDGGY